MATALITGATAGIGEGFAEALAREGHSLVLVARDVPRLQALADQLSGQYEVEVSILPADLADPQQRELVEDRVSDESQPVGILVNNAGFGVNHGFVGGDIAGEQQLIEVLVVAPMRLTHAALPGMVARGRGAILNVSSIAGWMTSGTYSAAKSWVTTFTEGLDGELKGTGVTATAVCPGLVHTEFHERAGMDMSDVPSWMWLTVDQVVEQALKDAKRGRPVSVAGTQYQIMSLGMRYTPRPLVRRASEIRMR